MIVEQGLDDQGDYFEFGVYRGFTFWYAQSYMRQLGNHSMKFVGLDSFAGLPHVDGSDAYKGDFYGGQFCAELDYVRKMLDRHGVDWNRTILVAGFYEDTLTPSLKEKYGLSKAVLTLIDCDLYASSSEALRFIADMLLDGSIIIFDDWNAFDSDDDRGERRAFREFLAAHPEWLSEPLFAYGSYGQVFQVRSSKALVYCPESSRC